jgi:hypothetical protein
VFNISWVLGDHIQWTNDKTHPNRHSHSKISNALLTSS